MSHLLLFQIGTLVSATTYLGLGYFVYINSRESIVNRSCLYFNISVAFWSIGFFNTMFWEVGYDYAILASRWSHVFAWFCPFLFYRFVTTFVKKEEYEKNARWNKLYVFLLLIFAILTVSTSLVIKNVVPKMCFPYYPNAGLLYSFFILNYVVFFSTPHLLMLKYYKDASLLKKVQMKYFFVALMVGWTGCLFLFPPFYGINITPYPMLMLPLFTIITTYAIVRHNLLDIEVIIKRTLVFTGLLASVSVILILPTLLMQEYIFRGTSFGGKMIGFTISAVIIILTMRRIESFLVNVTDKHLFQKKYDYRDLLKTFTSEVLTVLELDKLLSLTVSKLKEIIKLDSCNIELFDDKLKPDDSMLSMAGSKGYILRRDHPDIKEELIIPITMHNDNIGTLSLGKKKSDEEYTQDDLSILLPLARTLAIAISNAKLVDELGKTQAEAAQNEKMATIGTLAAGMAHEIRNPITTINTFADYLPERYTNKDFMGNFNKLVPREIDRVENIARALLEFSSIEDRGIEMFNMEEVIRNILSILEPQYKFTEIKISLDIKGPAIINNSKIKLQEAIFNIIKYIISESQKDAVISIYLDNKDSGRMAISITADKLHIPDAIIKDIFEPASKTQKTKRGFGFGLLIAKQLIEKAGSRFSISAFGNNGMEFRVDLMSFSVQPS